MKKELRLLSVLIVLLVSSCETYPPPKTELCLIGEGALVCNDARRPENQQDYEREITLDYVCTNPVDFGRVFDYCVDIREKLVKCRKDL